MPDDKRRRVMRYEFECGSSVEIVVTGPVGTQEALATARSLLDIKAAELESAEVGEFRPSYRAMIAAGDAR